MTNWHLPNQNTVTNRVDFVALSYRTRFFVAFKFHTLTGNEKVEHFNSKTTGGLCLSRRWIQNRFRDDSFADFPQSHGYCDIIVFGKLRYIKCFPSTWKHSSGEEGFGKAPFSWAFRKDGLGGRSLKLLQLRFDFKGDYDLENIVVKTKIAGDSWKILMLIGRRLRKSRCFVSFSDQSYILIFKMYVCDSQTQSPKIKMVIHHSFQNRSSHK